jgi:hypothetical protein
MAREIQRHPVRGTVQHIDFQVIDTKKLTELDAETVVEWHRRGWLAACFFHLASLQRVTEILSRRAKIATPIKPAV